MRIQKSIEKVYAVSSGSYSDYKVNAIFSTKELAEEFKSLVPNPEYNDIEEYDLDPLTTDLIKRGYSVWTIHMLIDGAVESAEKAGTGLYSVTHTGHYLWRRTRAPAYKGKGIPDILQSDVWAKTQQAAIKIVNEHRTQLIANGDWE
jgi:hypothetical protein